MADHFLRLQAPPMKDQREVLCIFFFFAAGIVLTQLLLALLNGGIDVRTSLLVHNPGDL